jgi:hypothetical protein
MSRSLEVRQHPAPSDRHTAQPTFEAEAATRERRAKRAGRDLGNDTAVSFPDVPLILLDATGDEEPRDAAPDPKHAELPSAGHS